MRKITLEELEYERVDNVKGEAYCSTNAECEHRGRYIRCYLDTCVNCPHYVPNNEIVINLLEELGGKNIRDLSDEVEE